MKRFMHWFGVFGMRFMAFALIAGEIEAVLTGRLPYDSWKGAFGIIWAAAGWTLGDFMARNDPQEGQPASNKEGTE